MQKLIKKCDVQKRFIFNINYGAGNSCDLNNCIIIAWGMRIDRLTQYRNA